MYDKAQSASPELLENLRGELRRGTLIVAVLAALKREQYGYTLRKSLAENHLDVDEGTLYPLLRRLESQGLLTSEWREHEKRNKRFYRLSRAGELILSQLLLDWEDLSSSIQAVLRQGEAKPGVSADVPGFQPDQNGVVQEH